MWSVTCLTVLQSLLVLWFSTLSFCCAMLVTPRRSFKTLFCEQDGGALLKSASASTLLHSFILISLISGTLQTSGKFLMPPMKYSAPNGIRSIAWITFLGGFSKGTPEEIFAAISKNRVHFAELVTRLDISDPRMAQDTDPNINNPLSQSEDSPWAKFFQNAELEKVINQDIERCYPDKDFFQQETVRSTMSKILFIYAKVNHALQYRQGMHELLAPIVYLLHEERSKQEKDIDPDDTQIKLDESEERILTSLLDKSAIEPDTYFIFKHLMDITGDWFSPGTQAKKTNGSIGSSSDEEAATTVVIKCRRIQQVLLKNKDPELHDHLQTLKIEPQFYLLRWVRLLLGREFHSLDDLMIIWDAIFAHSPDLVLVDYICVAMLVFIREQLLERDSTGCLTRLMKYPPVEDVRIFIEQAHTLISNRLQKPNTHQSPPVTQSTLPPTSNQSPTLSTPTSTVSSSSPPSSSATSKFKPPRASVSVKKDHDKVLQPINANIKHNLNIDTTTTDIAALQEQLRTLRDTQLVVAQRIESIVQSIQQTLTSNTLQGNIDPLFLSLAELKQTKDILCGFLPVSEPVSRIESDDLGDSNNLDHPLSDFKQV